MTHFVGLDVSVKETAVCVVDETSKVLFEQKVASEPDDIITLLTSVGVDYGRVWIEAGPLSQWLVNGMAEAGLPVICVETRHMKSLLKAQQVNKSDRHDARGIAQMMRVGLFKPVHVKTLASQEKRMLLTARKLVQRKMLDVECDLRGTLRNFGLKVGVVGKAGFEARIRELVEGLPSLAAIVEPLLTIIPVSSLINGRSIRWNESARVVHFHHVELADHDILVADGAPAESYRDDGNRILFARTQGSRRQRAKVPFAPTLIDGAAVDAAWRHLAARAGGPASDLTDDPDLHLIVDGRRLDPVSAEHGCYRFRLDGAPEAIVIASRAVVPAMVGTARDYRRLGVALRRIVATCDRRERVLDYASDLPAPDAGLGLARRRHDRNRADAIRRQQDDPCPPNMLPRRSARGDERLKPSPVRNRDGDADTPAHAAASHGMPHRGIPIRTRPFRSVH